MQPSRKAVQCLSPSGLHTMAYKEWGAADNPKVLICVHGLTRVADDFDGLARALMHEYRVICPDVVGRGASGWLKNPMHYQLPQYVSDMVTLLARANAQTVHWVGTSMGGLIGMGVASFENSPIQKFVLNDVGPSLDAVALARIAEYVGVDMRWNSYAEGAAYIRAISQTFGMHSEAQWDKFCRDVLRQNAQGQWIRHYDLSLAIPLQSVTPEAVAAGQTLLWAAYDAIQCPTLLIRGADSDLLTKATATEMQTRGTKLQLVELANIGHAPTLVQGDQIQLIKDFLLN